MRKIILLTLILSGCAAPMEVLAPPSLVNNPTKGPNVIRFELKNPSIIGKTSAGQTIQLGGFSGLRYLGTTADGKYRFLTHTDRGPNPEPYQKGKKTLRPFLLPKFQPRILYLEADPQTKELEIVKEILLTASQGMPISGIPQSEKMENPVDLHGKPLAYDLNGMDLEGIDLASDGSFWMVEEYSPSVLHFSAEGRLLERLKPEYGLPAVLKQRRLNRGFEGVARQENSLFAIMQSPLDNPASEDFKNSKNSHLVRLIEIDLKSRSTIAQYAYLLDSNKVDKIGDITVLADRKLLVIEQDGKTGPESKKKIFSIDLKPATNLQFLSEKIIGPGGSLELMSKAELSAKKIIPVQKNEIFDLAKLGVHDEKIEGIDIVDSKYLALVADNDFGVGGDLDRKLGTVKATQSKSVLYMIEINPENN